MAVSLVKVSCDSGFKALVEAEFRYQVVVVGIEPLGQLLGVLAIGLGILFESQNIAFMVGLAFSIAASCNFPVLLLSMYWKNLTTRGAMIGGWLGLISAVGLMILGVEYHAGAGVRQRRDLEAVRENPAHRAGLPGVV